MTTYQAPLRDIRFLTSDVLQIANQDNLPGFADATPDIVDAILEEASKIAQEVLHPLNQSGDAEGCSLKDGAVATPSGFKDAYKTYIDGGWSSLTCHPDFGGQGLPKVLGVGFVGIATPSGVTGSVVLCVGAAGSRMTTAWRRVGRWG